MPERSILKPAAATAVPALFPQGEQAGKPAMPLGRPFTLVGSRNRAHLHLLSSSVSRNHASIISTDNGLYLRDLASRTGVAVNSRRVKEVDLRDGDIVQIGSFKFKFVDPAGPVRFPITPKAAPAMLEIDGTTLTAVDGRSVLIGRRPTCDIPLQESSVSNTHALIFEVNGQRFIRDLGSRTGTLVNGKPVHHQPLDFGDHIRVGDTTIRYVSASAPQAEPEEQPAFVDQEQEAPIGLEFADERPAEAPAEIEHAGAEELLGQDDHAAIPLEPLPLDEPATTSARAMDAEEREREQPPIPIAEPEAPESTPAPDHGVTAPADLAEPGEDLGLDFWTEGAQQAVTADGASVSTDAEDNAEQPHPIALEQPTEAEQTGAPAGLASETAEPEGVAERAKVAPPGVAFDEQIAAERPSLQGQTFETPAQTDESSTVTDVAPLPPTPDRLEPAASAEPAIPERVEDVDLSAVDFGSAPAVAEEPPADIVEPAAEVAGQPAPILDLLVETRAPDVAASPDISAAPELPAPETGKKPRRSRRKSRAADRRSSVGKAEPDISQAPPALEPTPAPDSAVTAAEVELTPLHAGETVDVSVPPADLVLTHGAAEVVEPTEPSPESAQALEPAVDEFEPQSEPHPSQPVLEEAAITDVEFGQAVQDFAGAELGPIVDDPSDAAMPPETSQPQGAGASSPESAVTGPAAATEDDFALPEPDLSLEPIDPEAAQALTSDLSLEPPTEIDSTLSPPAGDFEIGELTDVSLQLEPASEVPPPADAGAGLLEEGIEPPLSLDDIPELAAPEAPPGAAAADHLGEPADTQMPIPPAGPARPPAGAPEPAPPRPAIHPFFGMERDLGSFIGGMPLPLTSQARSPAQAAVQQAPPPRVEPSPPPVPASRSEQLAVPQAQPAEETLTFPDEPEPIAFDESLLEREEPLELFDEAGEKLDGIPEGFEKIDDVSGSLADAELEPEFPTPPAQPPAPPPASALPFAGGPAATAAAPIRPKFTPPPPPRTSPLRSFTSSPVSLPGEEEVSPFGSEAQGRGREAAAPFSAALPPAQGRVTGPFGLAGPPVREADVFSHTAFPPLDEAIFGPVATEIPAIPPTARKAVEPATESPVAPAPEGASPPAVKPPRERKREAIPPNRLPPRRPPGHTASGAPAAPPPAGPAKRPWWKNIKILLPLLFIAIVVTIGLIVFFLGPRSLIQGRLQINGLQNLDVFARKEQVLNVRRSLRDPQVQQIAVERLKSQNPPLAAGFLQDPGALDQISQPQNSPFDEGRSALVLTRQTDDPEADKKRVTALIAAVCTQYASLKDRAAHAQRDFEQADSKVRELEQKDAVEAERVRKLSDEVGALAGKSAKDVLADLAGAIAGLQQKDKQLRKAWEDQTAVVRQRQSELERAQVAGAAPQTGPESDPTIRQINQALASLRSKLEAARLARDGKTDQAAAAFDEAADKLERQLGAVPAPPGGSVLADYLSRVRLDAQQVRKLSDELASRRAQDEQSLAQLRRQLTDRRAVNRRELWAKDEKLKDLLEEQDAQSHRYQAASDSGYADEAAKIKGVLEDLDQKIKARRAALDTGEQHADDLQQMQETIARIQQARDRDERQMQEKLSALESAVQNGPGGEQAITSALMQHVSAMQSARQRYAAALALSAGDADLAIKDLQSQIAELQLKLDSRRQDLATVAAARMHSDQDRTATLEAARQSLEAAQDAQQRASTSYTNNSKLLVACRELDDARTQTAGLLEQLNLARRDAQARQDELARSLTVQDPDQDSVAVSYGRDARVGYLIAAMLGILIVFSGPLWLSLAQSDQPQPPYATAVAVGHDVPGHEPDDSGSATDFEHEDHPAIA